jgi:GT2 family glycosyltransferase
MIFEPPTNEICDVIFLTKTTNEDVFKMTSAAINSLKESEEHNKFRVILVESQRQSIFTYENVDILVDFHDEEFNYNKALNMAFLYINSEYVAVFNNDVLFTVDWYSNLRLYMNVFNLDSASPWCPIPQTGPKPEIQRTILNYPPFSVIKGYTPILTFNGWGWVMKREVLLHLLPLDQTMKFWFQDDDMCMQLKQKGFIHGCVTNSHVIHFGQKSYSLIDQTSLHNLTIGVYQDYIKKWVQ